jgi:uncharacterized phiE125 gp8 family phage protein
MTTRLITPPAALPVTLAAAKKNLKIDGTDQDDEVSDWVRGIASHVEHYTGRALIAQQWRVTLDRFPDAINLEKSPIVSVEGVQFLDADGVLQTLDPADYIVDAVSEPGYVVPGRGKAWPATYREINAVSVDYTCGYGASPAAIPAGIKLYILAKLREQFDPAVRMERDTVQSSFIDSQLDPFKVYA